MSAGHRERLTPATVEEACSLIADARSGGRRLSIQGNGSKAGIGQVPAADTAILASTAINGISQYDAAELVFVAKAGTPLPEIEKALSSNNQRLAFEPANLVRLIGSNAAQTIGGIAATNMSGPRRLVAGAARDSLLGVRFVNGMGEEIKNGGQVMKNVTGLDLVKLMAGSWGTLGFLTEVSFKVLPATETETTLAIHGATDAMAASLMAVAMGTSCDVSAAAHLPSGVDAAMAQGPVTLLRVEGFERSVSDRISRLTAALHASGVLPDSAISEFEADMSRALWSSIRDVEPFADGSQTPVWKISVAPTSGCKVVADIVKKVRGKAYYDWQGGLVWLNLADEDDAAASTVRTAVAAHGGGHATLIRATEAVRAATTVFQPQAPAVAALSARVRASMDPDGVFDAGRMDGAHKNKAA